MIENIENEFLNYQTENPNSNFQNIQLDFGAIEEIKEQDENDLGYFYQENESEISRLISSAYDVNQIYLNPTYISKIVENKIKKFFSFKEFFLYFKNEPKVQKIIDDGRAHKNIKEKKSKKDEKVNEKKKEEIKLNKSEEYKEVKKRPIIEKKEEKNKNEKRKDYKENEEDINNNENVKELKDKIITTKCEIKSNSSTIENNATCSSKSKIKFSDSSTNKQISSIEIILKRIS